MNKDLEIKFTASEFRKNNGYSATSPIRLKSLLQKLDVIAVFKKLSDDFSGMSLKIEDQNFMLINLRHSLGRQHFTIAHELYHLYIQENFEKIICVDDGDDKNKRHEKRADAFATNLLLPQDGVIELIPKEQRKKDKITIDTLLKIEHYYSVSHSALLKLLRSIYLISDEHSNKLKPEIKQNAIAHGFATTLYDPGEKEEVIGLYGTKAKKLYDKEIISKSHYLQLMRDIGIDLE